MHYITYSTRISYTNRITYDNYISYGDQRGGGIVSLININRHEVRGLVVFIFIS